MVVVLVVVGIVVIIVVTVVVTVVVVEIALSANPRHCWRTRLSCTVGTLLTCMLPLFVIRNLLFHQWRPRIRNNIYLLVHFQVLLYFHLYLVVPTLLNSKREVEVRSSA